MFGRIDAYYGSKECQYTGALHLHMMIFVQCLHQHTPLQEIARIIQGKDDASLFVKKFTDYTEHICRERYDDLDSYEQRIHGLEEAWPLYEASAQLIVQPMVQSINQLEDGHDISDADAHVLRSDADLDCVRTEG